jgi:hypothetical protein
MDLARQCCPVGEEKSNALNRPGGAAGITSAQAGAMQ